MFIYTDVYRGYKYRTYSIEHTAYGSKELVGFLLKIETSIIDQSTSANHK